jgi:glycosyltransferase involved in cell wall biosynthesis
MKKKIAITFPQVPFVFGGAELQVKTLKNELVKRGFDAEIVSMPFKWFPGATLYNNLLSWRLLDISESDGQKIDLVIATKFPSYGVQHINKVTWLLHQFRGAYDYYDTQYGLKFSENGEQTREYIVKFDEIALKESREIFAESKNVRGRLLKYNGIDSEPLYHPPPLAGRYRCDSYGDYILSVGRLAPLKRIDLLIEAVAKSGKQVHVKVAGRGPDLIKLQDLAKKHAVEDRVEFLGFVNDDELLKLYANALAVYFAPVDEDYGYITLEAFLSKKPVVTCVDSGGTLEFVKHNENGYICEVNPEEIGEVFSTLLKNKTRCKAFGSAGFESVKGVTWDTVIEKLTRTL